MSSTYWKYEIIRYATWIQQTYTKEMKYATFNEAVDNMEKAIKKYKKEKVRE